MGFEWRGPCPVCGRAESLGSLAVEVPCQACWERLDKVERDCWASGIDPRPGFLGWIKSFFGG